MLVNPVQLKNVPLKLVTLVLLLNKFSGILVNPLQLANVLLKYVTAVLLLNRSTITECTIKTSNSRIITE